MFVMDFEQNKPAVNSAGLFHVGNLTGEQSSVLSTFDWPHR